MLAVAFAMSSARIAKPVRPLSDRKPHRMAREAPAWPVHPCPPKSFHMPFQGTETLVVLMDEQNGAGLSPRMVLLVADTRAQWAELDRRIATFDAEFIRSVRDNEDARRLITIPGFGAIVASALVAVIGRAESFDRGRDLSAWLRIVPRQFTTGGKPKLLRISKRGNSYLRRQTDPWSARRVALRRHRCKSVHAGGEKREAADAFAEDRRPPPPGVQDRAPPHGPGRAPTLP